MGRKIKIERNVQHSEARAFDKCKSTGCEEGKSINL